MDDRDLFMSALACSYRKRKISKKISLKILENDYLGIHEISIESFTYGAFCNKRQTANIHKSKYKRRSIFWKYQME